MERKDFRKYKQEPQISSEIADRMHQQIDKLPDEFMARVTLYEHGNPNPSEEELTHSIEGVLEYKKLMHRVFDVLAGREVKKDSGPEGI